MAGPNDIPIKNNNMVIPKAVPLWFTGADTNDILKAPISARANPIAIIQSSKDITSAVGWKIKSRKKPKVLITPPVKVGFMLPIFDIKNPDITEITNDKIMKGMLYTCSGIRDHHRTRGE